MVRIRPLQPEQWPLLKQMRLTALASAPEAYGANLADNLARSDEDWQTTTLRRLADPNQTMFLAYWDETPCGMAACHRQTDGSEMAELISMWVEPAFRRQGIAGALSEYGRQWAIRNGCRILRLGVTETNLPALALYQSLGFKDTGQRGEHRPDPRLSVLYLEMVLP